MSDSTCKWLTIILTVILATAAVHGLVRMFIPWEKSGNNNPTLPRLLTPPRVKNVRTSTIEIEWKGEHDGDGPVCGFIIELMPPALKSWTSVGFVSFDEDVDDFEYTIERLDADVLYRISVIILHCSGREGEKGPEISQSTEDYALPRLSTQPQVKNVTTSTIEIEWKEDYDGDGPVCGFIVELKPSASTSWTSVGFVSFDEDEDDFEYIIDRLDAGALYGISVIILHCSGREGERGSEISQSTEEYEPQPEPPSLSTSTAPSCPAQNCTECPPNQPEDDHRWRMMFLTIVPVLSFIVFVPLVILTWRCVERRRGEPDEQYLLGGEPDEQAFWGGTSKLGVDRICGCLFPIDPDYVHIIRK